MNDDDKMALEQLEKVINGDIEPSFNFDVHSEVNIHLTKYTDKELALVGNIIEDCMENIPTVKIGSKLVEAIIDERMNDIFTSEDLFKNR